MTPELLPCPFCGGEAETDSDRGYRALAGGKIGHAVAVYCLECNADIVIRWAAPVVAIGLIVAVAKCAVEHL